MAILYWRMSLEQEELPILARDMGFSTPASVRHLDLAESSPGSGKNTHCRDSYKVAWFQYFAISFWCLLLSTQAAFTRLWCQVGIPRDCQPHTTTVEFVKANHMLLMYGFMLAVFSGINHASRFLYIFDFSFEKPRGVAFLAIFFLSSPAWGSLDLVPALSSFSLNEGISWGIVTQLLMVTLIAGSFGAALWHFHHAWVHDIAEGFAAYVATRLVMLLLLVGYFLGSSDLSTVSFHLHHYIIGFYFAVLSEFNHPVSLVLLAAGSGVMAQGIGAYGADPLLSR